MKYAAGVAYWEHDYLKGATKSDNLVRRGYSTFTNILLPAAKAVGAKVAALPPINGCVPGQLLCEYLPITHVEWRKTSVSLTQVVTTSCEGSVLHSLLPPLLSAIQPCFHDMPTAQSC